MTKTPLKARPLPTLPGSVTHRAIHTAATTSPLGRALAALPAWAEARDRLLAVADQPTGPGPDPDDAVSEWLAEQLDTGKTPTPAAAAAVHAEAVGAGALARASVRLRDRLAADLDRAVTGNINALFGNLHEQLEAVITEATGLLEQLGPAAHDLEAAVDRDLVDEHRRLRHLRGEYAAIRTGQSTVFKATENMGRKLRDITTAYLRDPLAVDDELIPRRLGWRLPGTHDRERDPHPPPWPPLWEAESLDWVVEHPQAGAWVPNRQEMDAAEEAVAKACRGAAAERHGEHRDSLMTVGRVS
jgi:hypothetical protein